jgi:hypothetical protein
MTRPTILAVGLLVLIPAAGYAQQKPAYLLQTAPARKVETTYTSELRYPNLNVEEWELVVAKPRDLPCQSVAKVVVEPAGEDLTDASDLKQPLVRLLITPDKDARNKAVKVVVRTQATLMSRRLVPFPAGTKAPKVSPPDDEERKAALAVTSRVDHDEAAFQKWLDTNKLRRQKKESDVDFALRVFRCLQQTMTYKFPFDHDGKASSTCRAGVGDCGCLSAVFVSALRANDIPARQLVGRLVKSDRPIIDKPPYGAHARAEFFADGVGWVPVDPAFGVGDKSPGGLTQFGNDAGDFLVFHLDTNLVVETKQGGKANLAALQGVAGFARGEGNHDKPERKEDWRVKELPLDKKKK